MTTTYLQYGVSNELAQKLGNLKLTKTVIGKISNEILKNKYGLTEDEILYVKQAIKRKPIDKDIVDSLLENSNFTCCVCKGVKGSSYLIHHIEEYSIGQDNSYQNLAVLCPNDHDLAHKKGASLTMKITGRQIKNLKTKWEKEVNRLNVERASRSGNIFEVDFLNVPRILELYTQLYGTTPTSRYTRTLLDQNLITSGGDMNFERIGELSSNPVTPFIFFAGYGSTTLVYHYRLIFEDLIGKLNFKDLDVLLSKSNSKGNMVGEYCYFVGGLYSERLPDLKDEKVDLMKFYFKRKKIKVEWLVDPKYFVSNSAKWRTFHRVSYMIYGKIRSVNIVEDRGGRYLNIDIRPYYFGLPKERIDRTPKIAYRDLNDYTLDESEI